ncbi:hypothetical protein C0584_05685 [Candidatus Parcubacteria bacterium]|nr:MAG: hypothetical protein C0584_05685 [Candidatus Parcubacteria bacterium]
MDFPERMVNESKSCYEKRVQEHIKIIVRADQKKHFPTVAACTIFVAILSMTIGLSVIHFNGSYYQLFGISFYYLCALGFTFSERLEGRAVVSGMENVIAISFGGSLVSVFSGFLFSAYLLEQKFVLVLCILPFTASVILLFKGFEDGPVYGWD